MACSAVARYGLGVVGIAFSAAFARMPLFSTLDDGTRRAAAKDCLDHARQGGDGPLIDAACFVAMETDRNAGDHDDHLVGAILITLVPEGDLAAWESLKWRTRPPADAVARRMGLAHLTWIFVSPWMSFEGVGTALLAESTHALRSLGFQQLGSTFLLGNDASLCWHWPSGFRLLPHVLSKRRHFE